MAKIQEEIVVIKLSKLLKGDQKQTATLLPEDFHVAIEGVVAELVNDPGVVVEIEDVNVDDA